MPKTKYENPFQVGDWALHVSNQLDAREVAFVFEDCIDLRIGAGPDGICTGPVPARNYIRLPKEGRP